MRILVLGGTIFLGRHFVGQAAARGHELTLFHRGRHNPDLFPELDRVLGDRDGGLDALGDRTFDAVVDMCGYVPRVVAQSVARFAASAAHYTFVSSLSVYADNSVAGQDESAPTATIADPATEEVTGATYGALKRLCERQIERAFAQRCLIVRPGLIVGPHDPTDRFTSWPWRLARGGPVLVPQPGDARVEFTDVRDLARWILDGVEVARTGTFNVSGPSEEKMNFARLLEVCDPDAELAWAERAWLGARDVALWTDLPLCTDLASPGFSTRSTGRAVAAGMRFRPPAETVRDTLEWARRERTGPLQAGLSPEREAALVAALRSGR
jgi:2'-hydroxyisoflavone reductase